MTTQRKPRPLRIDRNDLAASMPTVSAAIEHEGRQALQSAYQIGQALDRAYHSWKLAFPGIHGDDAEAHFIEQISNAVMEPQEWLLSQWRLARAFDEKQFQWLCDAPGVSILSIEPLLAADSKVRSQLLERIVAEGLNGRKLEAAVQQLTPSRLKHCF